MFILQLISQNYVCVHLLSQKKPLKNGDKRKSLRKQKKPTIELVSHQSYPHISGRCQAPSRNMGEFYLFIRAKTRLHCFRINTCIP